MKNNINHIINILTIVANNQGITTRELCERTKIPIENLKNNLKLIYENPELYVVNLIPEDNDGRIKDYNDIKWFIDNIDEESKFLCLNPMEKYLYKSIVSDDNNYDEFLGIKTKSTFGLQEYKYKLCQISIAINNKKTLQIKYKKNDEIAEFLMEPLSIVFYEFENILYVIGQYDNNLVTYRLDRIVHIRETMDSFEPYIDFNIDDYLAHIWGMEQGDPVKVKIKFENVGNVLYKVMRDLHSRKNKKITKHTDYIIYEDIVIGINSFKRWLRTYGSSAIVIEPEDLKQEMINSAMKCLQYYL